MDYAKIINCLSNSEDKIFENEEIKLLLSAMNIIPGKYNSSKLRYGRIAICSDADQPKVESALNQLNCGKSLRASITKPSK